jgi:N6-L-threonylcarbamoyladenine synthase
MKVNSVLKELLTNNKSFFMVQKEFFSSKNVLGIETSCDDTAVAIVSTDRKILAESKYNQWSIHKKLGHAKSGSPNSWGGGVIPNLARKLHYENLVKAVSDCIEKMNKGWTDIDAIALTVKPGIEPCLYEGINFTKLLLKKFNMPFIPIHHMEAHALTNRLFASDLEYPYLTLLISGGHCILALVERHDKFYRLGECLDIAPGKTILKLVCTLKKNNSN